TPGLVLDHVIGRGIHTMLPAESLMSTATTRESPTATRADSGVTVTEPIGANEALTLRCVPSLCPSTSAMMNVYPSTRPVTRPVADTAATVSVPLRHVVGRPARSLPCVSCGTAVSWTCDPTRIPTESG